MNLLIILQSLKFYRLKPERTIQIWFVLLYAVNICITFLPFADSDFSAYAAYLDTLLSGTSSLTIFDVVSQGNWIYLGLMLLVSLLNGFSSLLYATYFILQRSGKRFRQALAGSLYALPRLALAIVLMIIPAAVSACLFFIPLIIFLMMLYFTPLNLSVNRLSLGAAMAKSTAETRGYKMTIFLEVVLLQILVSLPQNLVLFFVPLNDTAYALVGGFFAVLLSFMQGRMMGILYNVVVMKDQSVIPSKTNS